MRICALYPDGYHTNYPLRIDLHAFNIARKNLGELKRTGPSFWERFVTVDETWLAYYTPHTKAESMTWAPKGSQPAVKTRPNRFEKKIMLTVFWDEKGVPSLWISCQPTQLLMQRPTVSCSRNCGLSFRAKRIGLRSKGVLFHHDNARPHKTRTTTDRLAKYGWRVIPQTPYSPDTAPSDYALFTRLKKDMRGTRYKTEHDLKAKCLKVLGGIEQQWFREGHT